MKIVHTLLRYPPATGGVEEYTKEIVERLRARGEDIRVETTNLKMHHPPTFLDPPPIDPPYVHRHTAKTFDSVGYPIPEYLKDELQEMAMDLIHAHAFWYAPADIAARVAKSRHIPFVLNTYYYNTDNRRTMKWQLYRILYGRSTVAAADAVVVISPYEESLLKKDNFIMQRTELIPPGIDTQEFEKTFANPFPKWKIDSPNILLFAGRIAHAKGVDTLIDAFAKIIKVKNDCHLVIIGEDFGYKNKCEKRIKELGIEKFITWTGKVNRDELLGAYQNAKAFLFPSRFEAFGIVLLEAAACGCPAIATNATAIPYVVKDGKTGLLFEPENAEDLAKKTIQFLQNQELQKELANTASSRAKTEFSWDHSLNKLYNLYNDLVRNHQEK